MSPPVRKPAEAAEGKSEAKAGAKGEAATDAGETVVQIERKPAKATAKPQEADPGYNRPYSPPPPDPKAVPTLQQRQDKMLAALDAWWLEKGEEMKKHPIASPEAMWKHFTKLVIKTLQ